MEWSVDNMFWSVVRAGGIIRVEYVFVPSRLSLHMTLMVKPYVFLLGWSLFVSRRMFVSDLSSFHKSSSDSSLAPSIQSDFHFLDSINNSWNLQWKRRWKWYLSSDISWGSPLSLNDDLSRPAASAESGTDSKDIWMVYISSFPSDPTSS